MPVKDGEQRLRHDQVFQLEWLVVEWTGVVAVDPWLDACLTERFGAALGLHWTAVHVLANVARHLLHLFRGGLCEATQFESRHRG